MLRGLMKLFAYEHFPRTTFAVRHPRTTSQIAKTRWDLKHARAPRVAGIGAALIAIPVGYVIGRLVQKHVDSEVARGGSGGAVFGTAERPATVIGD
jgi:hypothetical protein